MLAHLAAYVGPCWPILGHKSRKMGTAKNTVKCGSFWWYVVVGGRGGGPLSPSERRELPYGKDGQLRAPRAPGRISAYARQPARGSTILPPSCGYVGLCWPTLAYLAGNVGPAWGYVGPAPSWAMLAYLEGCVGRSWGLCWPIVTHVKPKDPKNGNSKKTLVLWLCWPLLAHLGAMLASMWAHLGAMLAHLGPILGLGWPILGLCWPILRPMLAHVTHLRPQESKNGSSKKHRKTQVFLVVGGRGGGQLRAPRPPGRI